jgi:anthranilate synthase component 1
MEELIMLLKKFPDKKTYCQLSSQYNVIPVCTEILADTETPVSLLNKFHGKSPVFLLESVEGGERWGRYSFLGTSARSHIRIFSDHVEILQGNVREEILHHGNPLSVLRNLMKSYSPAIIDDLPRFWGGMVGYLTYEMVSFFEKIPNQWPKNKPMAHFIIPDEIIIFDNIQNTLKAMVITFTEDAAGSPDQAYDQAFQRINRMLSLMKSPIRENEVEQRENRYHLTPMIAEEQFRSHVEKTKQYIKAGDIIQAVISQPFLCDPPPDLWSLYRAQRYVNPSPYMYFMDLGNIALVGSSPETMVRLENGIATLRPIAGTRPRGRNEQEDRALADELLKDEKERAEHLMLVDLGRNDLGRIAEIGTVQVTDLMIVERYSHVMHLVSNIHCDLKPECDAWELLAATFPAGTLSGAPKIRAMEIIAELEKEPRGPYGGAVGYISFSGNMDMAITIRTACIENNKLIVRAGAGIVADSDPEKERIETVNKAMAIQRALQLVQANAGQEGRVTK